MLFGEFHQLAEHTIKPFAPGGAQSKKKKRRHAAIIGTGAMLQSRCGWCINSSGLFHFFPPPPPSGANPGGKERTVTGACPSPAACTAPARGHGSACARRAGWAASVTEVSLVALYLPVPLRCLGGTVRERIRGSQRWSNCRHKLFASLWIDVPISMGD